MNISHKVGDLVLVAHPKFSEVLGIIQKKKRDGIYDVYWLNPILEEDISIESDESIKVYKKHLQEYMDEHRTQNR